MRKKVACLSAVCLAGAIAASVGLAGCGASAENGSLSIMLLSNNQETAFYKEYFKDMEEEYKVDITFNGYESGPYYERLASLSQQKKMPDIFYVRPNEILQYKDYIQSLQSFADKQTEVDLTTVYDLALDMYRYNPTTKKMDAENGELYAFPKDLSTQQLGYNKKLLLQYETQIKTVVDKMPWDLEYDSVNKKWKETYTWEEYRGICEAITQASKGSVYGCDIPNIEVLVKSYGGKLLADDGETVTLNNEAVQNAIEMQAKLCSPSGQHGEYAAADIDKATYSGFQAGKCAFYGACGSWEISSYDKVFPDGWGLMPWPTVDGGGEWYGLITSAGYVVSKDCKIPEIAMKIAASFMTPRTQDKLVREKKISLPITPSLAEAYVNPENDSEYSPASRNVFIDVISGKNGFVSTKYSVYNNEWFDALDAELAIMWDKLGDAESHYNSVLKGKLATLQQTMQNLVDANKNK